jgi:DNA repair exonuclease SbcCD nuclease subunit
MVTLLHAADLHLGLEFGQLREEDRLKLARARLDVVDQILSLADQYSVDAVLFAGDIFDSPDPGEDWWRALADKFRARRTWTRSVVLLPGNHDPLTPGSVFSRDHEFRSALPEWVKVVDSDSFELPLGETAVVLSRPCRSRAGAEDLALALPMRAAGDSRIRIGLVHGSTFDLPDHQTNFPIARDAARQRGLDYLAVGDTHGYRVIGSEAEPPIVYPGAPEPTKFGESEAGNVVLVTLRRAGALPRLQPIQVARWTWRDETVQSLESLRRLATEDLTTTVLRLHLDMTVTVLEEKEVDQLVRLLQGTIATHGRAGAFVLDRSRLRVQAGAVEDVLRGAPELLQAVGRRLAAQGSDEASRALQLLSRMIEEAEL